LDTYYCSDYFIIYIYELSEVKIRMSKELEACLNFLAVSRP